MLVAPARKLIRAAVVLAATALLASSCTSISHKTGSESNGPAASGVTSGPAGSAAPVRGGTLTVGRVADIVSTDGDVIGAANDDISNNAYDTLIKYDAKLQPQPDLAISWAFNSDKTQLTLHLRHDVTFQNGKPFTSADVKYTTERVRDPKVNSQQLGAMSKWITKIDTPDPYTVVYTMDQPRPNILDLLAYLCIVDQQTVTGPNAKTTANGTGPYELASWKPGIEVVLKRNNHYWNKDLPLLDEIDLKIMGDAQSQLTALQGGTVDVAENLPPQQASSLGGGYATLSETFENYYIAVNVKNPQLAHKPVRQAINYAIDRKRIVNDVFVGKATPLATFWPPSSPAYDQSQADAYSFNLNKAKQLLSAAGVTNLKVNLITNANQPALTSVAQILQADLATIGVKLTVDNLQVPQWRAQAFGATYQGLEAGPYGFNNVSPQTLFALSTPFSPSKNFSNFSDPAYTKLVQQALSATDAAQGAALSKQVASFLQDQSYIMPIATHNTLHVSRSTVHGLQTLVTGGLYFANVFVTK